MNSTASEQDVDTVRTAYAAFYRRKARGLGPSGPR